MGKKQKISTQVRHKSAKGYTYTVEIFIYIKIHKQFHMCIGFSEENDEGKKILTVRCWKFEIQTTFVHFHKGY